MRAEVIGDVETGNDLHDGPPSRSPERRRSETLSTAVVCHRASLLRRGRESTTRRTPRRTLRRAVMAAWCVLAVAGVSAARSFAERLGMTARSDMKPGRDRRVSLALRIRLSNFGAVDHNETTSLMKDKQNRVQQSSAECVTMGRRIHRRRPRGTPSWLHGPFFRRGARRDVVVVDGRATGGRGDDNGDGMEPWERSVARDVGGREIRRGVVAAEPRGFTGRLASWSSPAPPEARI